LAKTTISVAQPFADFASLVGAFQVLGTTERLALLGLGRRGLGFQLGLNLGLTGCVDLYFVGVSPQANTLDFASLVEGFSGPWTVGLGLELGSEFSSPNKSFFHG